ncbi:MAG: hypothetical protein J7M29_09580, partial [Verrucomicrobia bacterium]|nr:hypothetical protein [Verrucomicrobiota bacterium]
MAKKAPTKNLGLLALGHLAWATACALALVIAFHARRETMAVRLRSEALGLAWAIRVEEAAHLGLSGKPVSTPWFQKTLRSFLTAHLRALGSREARLMFRPEAGPPIELEATSAAEPLPSHFGLRLGRVIARYIPPPAGSVIVSGEVWNYPKEASAMLSPLVPRPSQGWITIRLTLSESLWARWLFREAHFFGLMGLGGLALVWLWFAARKVPRGRNGADPGRGRAARNALLTFLSGLWAASLVAWDLDALQMQRRARLFHKLAGERAAACYSEFLRILNVGELLRGFFLGSEEVLPEEFRAFVACGKGSGFLGLPEIRLAAWGESGGEGGSGAFQLRASVCASPRLREIFSARLESESAKAAVESLRRMEVIASK